MKTWLSRFKETPSLEESETVEHFCLGSMAQGRWLSAAGRVYITSRRLVFTPDSISRLCGGLDWAIEYPAIEAVGVKPPQFSFAEIFRGGISERLRVEARAGDKEVFTVRSPESFIAKLEAAILKARKEAIFAASDG